MTREVPLNISPLQYVTGSVINWQGDQPPTFSLAWTLTAGFDHPALKNREALLEQIKIAQGFAASAGANGGTDASGQQVLKGPAKLRLIIPGHINCVGLLRSIRTSEQGPWGTKDPNPASTKGGIWGAIENATNPNPDGMILPTSCEFTAEFVPFPSYDETLISKVSVKTWLAKDVYDKFYQNR